MPVRLPMLNKIYSLSLCCLLAFGVAGTPLTAQENSNESAEEEVERLDPGPFKGFWEIQEPAGDSCIVIVKRGGQVSSFWTGTRNTSILKGSWHRENDKLVAEWDSGHTDVFVKLGENAIERRSFGPEDSLDESSDTVVRGVRVDSRSPGSLAVSRDYDEEPAVNPEETEPDDAPALPMRNTYTGFWEVSQSTGMFGIGNTQEHFYLRLHRNGKATVALRNWGVEKDVTGKWRIRQKNVLVVWPNGRRDVLSKAPDGDSYVLKEFPEKLTLNDTPATTRPAKKVNATDATRYFTAGGVGELTVVDIRGTWTPKEPGDGKKEFIEIEGWGNAYRHPSKIGDGSEPGKWRLLNDRVIITWVDGSKYVIRQAGSDFILESYAPGDPTTSSPSRTVRVTKAP